jgi:hypothetical protein
MSSFLSLLGMHPYLDRQSTAMGSYPGHVDLAVTASHRCRRRHIVVAAATSFSPRFARFPRARAALRHRPQRRRRVPL